MTLAEMARYFAEHAASDLKHAQAIARSDQSGHALATAMYLAQQSIEKQLKSVVINMDKKMKLGKSESIAKSLGHHLYPRLCKLYATQIANLDVSPILPDWPFLKDCGWDANNMARVGRGFTLMSELWTMHFDSPQLQSLLWRNSMGITLDESELLFLNSKHNPYMQGFLELGGKGDEEIPQLVNNGHTQRPMLDIIADDALLTARRNEYADIDINTDGRALLEQSFRFFQLLFDIVPNPVPKKSHADKIAVTNIVFSFGVQILISVHIDYLFLFTNSSYGRYPHRLEKGLITTNMYASQVDRVLYYLFVDIPYKLEQLCVNSEMLDMLLEMGSERRCW